MILDEMSFYGLTVMAQNRQIQRRLVLYCVGCASPNLTVLRCEVIRSHSRSNYNSCNACQRVVWSDESRASIERTIVNCWKLQNAIFLNTTACNRDVLVKLDSVVSRQCFRCNGSWHFAVYLRAVLQMLRTAFSGYVEADYFSVSVHLVILLQWNAVADWVCCGGGSIFWCCLSRYLLKSSISISLPGKIGLCTSSRLLTGQPLVANFWIKRAIAIYTKWQHF